MIFHVVVISIELLTGQGPPTITMGDLPYYAEVSKREYFAIDDCLAYVAAHQRNWESRNLIGFCAKRTLPPAY